MEEGIVAGQYGNVTVMENPSGTPNLLVYRDSGLRPTQDLIAVFFPDEQGSVLSHLFASMVHAAFPEGEITIAAMDAEQRKKFIIPD